MLSMVSSLPSPVSASNDDATTFDVPSTIDANGERDVTNELMTFITSVPDGSTIAFPAEARYRIDTSLVIEGRNDLTFEGNGAEFFATTDADRNRRHWWIRNSKGITVRDVVVRGANPNAGTSEAAYRSDREAQHGFDFAGVENVLLERVNVTDVYGDFVYIGLGKRGWSKNVTVRDSRFERNGRQGVSITAGQDILIERNVIRDVRRSTFDLEPNGTNWGARRVMITDNDIGPGRLNFIAGHGYAAPFDDIKVIGNRLKGKTMNVSLKAPDPSRRSNFSLIGNISDASYGSPAPPIVITGFDGVTIRDNVMRLDAGRKMTVVGLTLTCDVVVAGNQFTNAAQDVKTDGYECAKAAVPAPTTTTPASIAPGSSLAASSTTRRVGAAAPGPARTDGVGGAVDEQSTEPESAARSDADAIAEHEDEVAEALTDRNERLVDPPASGDDAGYDRAIWALVIGAVVSAAVLVPLSRSSRRSRSGRQAGR
jgi:hypothetical protein